jgi:hypothetical protein
MPTGLIPEAQGQVRLDEHGSEHTSGIKPQYPWPLSPVASLFDGFPPGPSLVVRGGSMLASYEI